MAVFPPRAKELAVFQDRYSVPLGPVRDRQPEITNPGNQVFVIGTAITPFAIAVTPLTAAVTLTGLPGLTYDTSTRMVSGTPSGTATTTKATIIATDTSGNEVRTQFFITLLAAGSSLTGYNFPPSITNPRNKHYIQPRDFRPFDIVVTDEGATAPTVTVTGLAAGSGLRYDSTNRRVVGTIPTAYRGNMKVRITASDGTNTSFTEFFIAVGTEAEIFISAPTIDPYREGPPGRRISYPRGFLWDDLNTIYQSPNLTLNLNQNVWGRTVLPDGTFNNSLTNDYTFRTDVSGWRVDQVIQTDGTTDSVLVVPEPTSGTGFYRGTTEGKFYIQDDRGNPEMSFSVQGHVFGQSILRPTANYIALPMVGFSGTIRFPVIRKGAGGFNPNLNYNAAK